MSFQRIFAVAAIVIVAGVVAAAFAALGPPGKARGQAMDRRRLWDLSQIAQKLHDDYDPPKRPLPAHPTDAALDPVTKKPYDYRRLGAARYELCALFAQPMPPENLENLGNGNNPEPFWRHGAGRTCYRFDVTAAPPGVGEIRFTL
ncbi:MAG: hypothetical protein WB609_05425 [Candidatus Cybelea sp.]